MTQTETKEAPRWVQRLKSIWTEYLQVGAVMGILGAIGFWIWFMTLWGLWGFFLGWTPAALLGLALRFIWLPVLLAGLFLLLQALPSKVAVIIFNIFLFGIIYSYAADYAQKNFRRRSNDKS